MKRLVLMVVALAVAVGTARAGGRGFSNKDLKGSYVEEAMGGSADNNVRFNSLGSLLADGLGHFTGFVSNDAASAAGSSTCGYIIGGTYTVHSDGAMEIDTISTPESPGPSCGTGPTKESAVGEMVNPDHVIFQSASGGALSRGTLTRQHQ